MVLFSACGIQKAIGLSSSDNPNVRYTLLKVTDDYFRRIAAGNINMVDQYVIWGKYESVTNGVISRRTVMEEVLKLKDRWPIQNHPLRQLEVISVDIYENEASLLLSDRQTSRRVEIDLNWTGNSWLISRDTLFGPQGFLNTQGS